MSSRKTVLFAGILGVALAVAAPASAQKTPLAKLLPTLFGPSGFFVDSTALLPNGDTHSAHFNSSFGSTPFQGQFNSQLASVPLPAPASGFTYSFDPAAGAVVRSTKSYGPVFADRAETIGRRRFSVAMSAQRFTFDSVDGQDLGAIPIVLTHDDAQLGGGRSDLVTLDTELKATLTQITTAITFGLNDRLDLSLAVPTVESELAVTAQAQVRRIGTTDPAVHHFNEPEATLGSRRTFSASGKAQGVGDVTLRLKGTALSRPAVGLALGLDVRLPTGDEQELLGTGALGVKPFLALSFPGTVASTHVNLAYQWNGDSVLAGDLLADKKGDFPDLLFYALGVDLGVGRATLALDILGQRQSDGTRLIGGTFTAANGTVFPTSVTRGGSLTQTSGSVGLKIRAGKRALLTINALFRLDESGLTDDVVPLVGVEIVG